MRLQVSDGWYQPSLALLDVEPEAQLPPALPGRGRGWGRSKHGISRKFPLKGSLKGDIDIGADIHVDMDIDLDARGT